MLQLKGVKPLLNPFFVENFLAEIGKHFFINGKNDDENKYLIETTFRQTNLPFSRKSNNNKIKIKNKEMLNVALLDVRARCVDLFIYRVKARNLRLQSSFLFA